jgi:hypothetical protein
MDDNLDKLKRLQADLHTAFETVFAAKDAKSRAVAKERLIGLGSGTVSAAMGPAFSIIQLTGAVSALGFPQTTADVR